MNNGQSGKPDGFLYVGQRFAILVIAVGVPLVDGPQVPLDFVIQDRSPTKFGAGWQQGKVVSILLKADLDISPFEILAEAL